MEQFFLSLLIGSIALTLAFNLLSAIFPETTARLQYRLIKAISIPPEDRTDTDTSFLKFILPLEALLILSLALAIAVNIGSLLAL